MAEKVRDTFVVGEILDKLERCTKEVARSLDSIRDRLDYERLDRARETLRTAMDQLDSLIAARPGG